jgi:ParB family chromosome partitioning protein
MSKKKALGRGLGALISDAGNTKNALKREEKAASINEIALRDIDTNPYQPRTQFDEEALDELSTSIKQIGIVQPITVRKRENGRYQIIAGERRYRASKRAGLESIPAYIRSADDDSMLELALVENIQRENLDAIEIAISYQRLIEECQLTQEKLSERVGKKRATVSNYLRLLKLPAQVQIGIREKNIAMGHARAILGLEDSDTQLMLFNQILEYGFSVRKVEELVRELNNPMTEVDKAIKEKKKDTDKVLKEEFKDLQTKLAKYFSSKVQLKCSTEGDGKIVIPFNSNEDLERILGVLDNMN